VDIGQTVFAALFLYAPFCLIDDGGAILQRFLHSGVAVAIFEGCQKKSKAKHNKETEKGTGFEMSQDSTYEYLCWLSFSRPAIYFVAF
jgi:hypothetical protein